MHSSSSRHALSLVTSSYIARALVWALIGAAPLWSALAQPSAPTPAGAERMSSLPLPDQGPALSPDTGVRAGQWALSFAFPSGGFGYQGFDDAVGSLGAWRLVTHEVALGLFAGLRMANQDVTLGDGADGERSSAQLTSSELTLSPSVKYYTYQRGPIALFGIAQVHFRFYSDGDEATTTDKEPGVGETYNEAEDLQLRAQLGFGAEWFATTSLSVAGHFGLQLDLLSQGARGLTLETFTSGLSVQLYF